MTEHILIKPSTDFQLKSVFEQVIAVQKKKKKNRTVLGTLQKIIQKKFKSVVILKIKQI